METESGAGGLTYRYTYGRDKVSAAISGQLNGAENLVQDGQVKLWYHHDRMGSTEYLTDNVSGKVTSYVSYDSWGAPTMKPILKMGVRELDLVTEYTGYTYDQVLGLYFAQARMYDASDRRFMAEDPIKDGWNWYAYCGNNPVRFVDPWGMFVDINIDIDIDFEGLRECTDYLASMDLNLDGMSESINDFYNHAVRINAQAERLNRMLTPVGAAGREAQQIGDNVIQGANRASELANNVINMMNENKSNFDAVGNAGRKAQGLPIKVDVPDTYFGPTYSGSNSSDWLDAEMRKYYVQFICESGIYKNVWGVGGSAIYGLCLTGSLSTMVVADRYGNIGLLFTAGIGGGFGEAIGFIVTEFSETDTIWDLEGTGAAIGASILYFGTEYNSEGIISGSIGVSESREFHAVITKSWIVPIKEVYRP